MNKAEVLDLFIEIKQEYPFFDDSDDNVERHLRYLRDFPFDVAMKNVEEHILTNSKKHPGMADIRGRLGDQLDSQRSKEESDSFFAQIDLWKRADVPPPTGYWESIRDKLRGDSA